MIMREMEEEHLTNLAAMLQKLKDYQKRECKLILLCVEYLGNKIYAERLHALDSKVEAITNTPDPFRAF